MSPENEFKPEQMLEAGAVDWEKLKRDREQRVNEQLGSISQAEQEINGIEEEIARIQAEMDRLLALAPGERVIKERMFLQSAPEQIIRLNDRLQESQTKAAQIEMAAKAKIDMLRDDLEEIEAQIRDNARLIKLVNNGEEVGHARRLVRDRHNIQNRIDKHQAALDDIPARMFDVLLEAVARLKTGNSQEVAEARRLQLELVGKFLNYPYYQQMDLMKKYAPNEAREINKDRGRALELLIKAERENKFVQSELEVFKAEVPAAGVSEGSVDQGAQVPPPVPAEEVLPPRPDVDVSLGGGIAPISEQRVETPAIPEQDQFEPPKDSIRNDWLATILDLAEQDAQLPLAERQKNIQRLIRVAVTEGVLQSGEAEQYLRDNGFENLLKAYEQFTPENSPIGGEVVEFTYPPSQGWLDAILRAAQKWQGGIDVASGNVRSLIQAGVGAGAITAEEAEQYLREHNLGRLIDTSHRDRTEPHRPDELDKALASQRGSEKIKEDLGLGVINGVELNDADRYNLAEIAKYLEMGVNSDKVQQAYRNFATQYSLVYEDSKLPNPGQLLTAMRDGGLHLPYKYGEQTPGHVGWDVSPVLPGDNMGTNIEEIFWQAIRLLPKPKEKKQPKTVEVPDPSTPSAPEAELPTPTAAEASAGAEVTPDKPAKKTPGRSLWESAGRRVGRIGRFGRGLLRGRGKPTDETPASAAEPTPPPEPTPSTEEGSLGRNSVEGVRDKLSRQVAMLKDELKVVKSAKASEKDHPEALRVEIRNAMATLFRIYTLLFEASEHNLNYLPVPSVTKALDVYNLANDHVLKTPELSDSLAINLNMIAVAGREQPEIWREMVAALNLLEQDKKINLNSSIMIGLRAKLNSAASETPPRPEPPNPDSPPNSQESVLSPREERALGWDHDGIKRQAEQFFEVEFNEISNWRNLDESKVCAGILGMIGIYVKIPDHWQEWVKRAGRESLTTGINVPFFGADGRLQRGYISDADDYATMFRSLSNWYRTTMSGLDRNKLTADPFLNSSVNVNNLAEADRLFGNVA